MCAALALARSAEARMPTKEGRKPSKEATSFKFGPDSSAAAVCAATKVLSKERERKPTEEGWKPSKEAPTFEFGPDSSAAAVCAEAQEGRWSSQETVRRPREGRKPTEEAPTFEFGPDSSAAAACAGLQEARWSSQESKTFEFGPDSSTAAVCGAAQAGRRSSKEPPLAARQTSTYQSSGSGAASQHYPSESKEGDHGRMLSKGGVAADNAKKKRVGNSSYVMTASGFKLREEVPASLHSPTAAGGRTPRARTMTLQSSSLATPSPSVPAGAMSGESPATQLPIMQGVFPEPTLDASDSPGASLSSRKCTSTASPTSASSAHAQAPGQGPVARSARRAGLLKLVAPIEDWSGLPTSTSPLASRASESRQIAKGSSLCTTTTDSSWLPLARRSYRSSSSGGASSGVSPPVSPRSAMNPIRAGASRTSRVPVFDFVSSPFP
mmetsp:Transcript_57209/g.185929  ORF Transcript_57209/g.185929 Transcript_57209/m.185929 type:complete len:439 (+) Transcript_57209:68-1384(+)